MSVKSRRKTDLCIEQVIAVLFWLYRVLKQFCCHVLRMTILKLSNRHLPNSLTGDMHWYFSNLIHFCCNFCSVCILYRCC